MRDVFHIKYHLNNEDWAWSRTDMVFIIIYLHIWYLCHTKHISCFQCLHIISMIIMSWHLSVTMISNYYIFHFFYCKWFKNAYKKVAIVTVIWKHDSSQSTFRDTNNLLWQHLCEKSLPGISCYSKCIKRMNYCR